MLAVIMVLSIALPASVPAVSLSKSTYADQRICHYT